MKVGVKEFKQAYKNVNIDKIEVDNRDVFVCNVGLVTCKNNLLTKLANISSLFLCSSSHTHTLFRFRSRIYHK